MKDTAPSVEAAHAKGRTVSVGSGAVLGGLVPTAEEARAILRRFTASHFKMKDREHARYRIPADPRHDDDIRLAAFIDRAERIEDAAKCIRHWHDTADGGMIVSGEHVRKLWEALSSPNAEISHDPERRKIP